MGMKVRQEPAHMKALLARRERGGWSWAELSLRSGRPVWKLRWWHQRFAKSRPKRRRPRTFVPVEVVETSPRESSSIEVVTPAGFRILLPADFTADQLDRLIKVLAPTC